MPFGLIFSFACHAALLIWAYGSMRAVPHLPVEETPMISAEIITPSEFLRLKQGSEDAKKLETKAKDEPKPDDSKNDTKKPDNALAPPPPPPPQEVAKVEPPPASEPPKVEPPPEPPKVEPPPPPPEPTPGPTPDEQKLLEQKIEEDRKKAEEDAKKKLDEEAKKKADAEAKKKAEEALKKKLADEAKKKKADDAKKKAAEEAKKFDANKLANLIDKAPDDAQQKALLDKDPTKKGQQAAGTSQTAKDTGLEAGTKTGTDTVLSAREQDLLNGMISQQLKNCSQMPGGGGGVDTPIIKLTIRLNPDGSLSGEPIVLQPQNTPLFEIAARASVNAVKNCSPLQLPPESYGFWKDFDWEFNWPKLLGFR